jgi:hypothetical protein
VCFEWEFFWIGRTCSSLCNYTTVVLDAQNAKILYYINTINLLIVCNDAA